MANVSILQISASTQNSKYETKMESLNDDKGIDLLLEVCRHISLIRIQGFLWRTW